MAISVKQFPNPLNCDEPAYAVQVAYDADVASGGADICNGNGTNTTIYGNYTTLSAIYSNSATQNAANTDICDNGMDVVFVVDYTGSMGNAINGVKSGIAQIASEIDTQTSGNYRLGLVIYDEYNDSGQYSTIQYAGSGFYQNLPSDQKVIETNATAGKKQVYTCLEKMNTIGNIGNASSGFTQGLNALNAASNSSTGMVLGNGVATPEPGGIASFKTVNDFAGSWRSGVLKLIIHITDNRPGGDDDTYNSTDVTFFQNTLTPALDNNNIQFFHNSDDAATNTSNVDTYKYAVENTTPAGLGNYNVSYNGTWYTDIVNGIQDLCDETTTYSCDPAPAGWYADLPITLGSTVAYYWDGSAWTNSYACPLPTYTVTVDIVDGITSGHGSVDNIPINHPNYSDIDTLTFSGNPGQVFTATIDTSVGSGYQNLSLNISNVSDTNVITNTSLSNNPGNAPEVTIQVTIGNGNSAESLQVNGMASIIQRTLRIDVIGDVIDTQDGDGANQSPSGYIDPQPATPAAASWTNVGIGGTNAYSNYAYRTEITANPGTSHTVDVAFDRIPSDYTLDVDSVTTEGYTLAGNGGGTLTAALNTISGMTFSNGNQNVANWSGNVTIGNSDLWVKAYFGGDVDQPDFRITVYASETITGASIIGNNGTAFLGYVGETFNFSKLLQLDPGYTNLNVTGVIADVNYSGNSALSNIQATSNNDGGQCVVTMPSGAQSGSTAGIVINGTADQIQYNYVITILDTLSTTTWSQVTLTGPAGSQQSTTATALVNQEYDYNITTISNDDSSNLTSTITSASAPSIGLTVPSMPLGGGSASVTLGGTQIQKTYDFDIDIIEDPAASHGSWVSNSATVNGTAGQVLTGTFTWSSNSGYTHSGSGHSTTSTDITDTTFGTPGLTTDWEVTMPSGGGTGTITVDNVVEAQTTYTYNVYFDNSQLSNSGNMSLSPASPIVVTGTAGSSHNLSYCLTPSPSYWVVAIQQSNITTHDGTGSAGTASEIAIGTVAGTNPTCIYFTLTMPQGGGNGYIRPKGAINNPNFDMIVTGATQIGNTSIVGTNPVTLTGKVGDALTTTFDVASASGYSHDVTGVSISNNYSNSVTGSATVSEDMKVDVTMPVGGGSTTATATGTSQTSAVAMTINFTEDVGTGTAAAGAWDNTSLTFTGAPGSTHNLSNSWRITNQQQFRSGSSTFLTISGQNGAGQLYVANSSTDPSGGTFSTTTPTSGVVATTSGTLTMPQGGGTYTIKITARQLGQCDCIDVTPPIAALTPETNGNANGIIDLTFTQTCGAIISTISYTYNGTGQIPNWATNTVTNKELRGLSAGTHAFTIQYDDCTECCDSHTITFALLNTTTTTTTTTSSGSGGQGLSGPKNNGGLPPGGPGPTP